MYIKSAGNNEFPVQGRLITSNRPFRASPVTYCVSSEEESDGKEESDEDSQEGENSV